MDGSTMDCRIARGNLHCADRVFRRETAHRYHKRTAEAAGWRGRSVRAVHGDVAAFQHMPNRHAFGEQGLLKGKGAADHEADQVVAPQISDILSLLDQLALAEDAIARQIMSKVDVLTQYRHPRVARLGDCQQRTGPGIGLTEAQEIKGRLFRKDDQVALDETRCLACGRTVEVPVPDTAAQCIHLFKTGWAKCFHSIASCQRKSLSHDLLSRANHPRSPTTRPLPQGMKPPKGRDL